MPARTKKPAKEVAAAASSSEADAGAPLSDDDDQSDVTSDSADESGHNSDSLDSSAPRKRRRLSPGAPSEDEAEDDEIPKASATFTSAPSRIKKRDAVGLKPVPPGPSSKATEAPAAVFGGVTTAPTDPNTNFEALGVHPWLVQSLTNMAIRRPTGIQKGCIPEILKGRDCIGGSRTGSGKTVAFAVPILQKWAEDPSAIFALVLTPTRYAWSVFPSER